MSATGTTRVLRLGDSMAQGLATMDGGTLSSELATKLANPWFAGTMDGPRGAYDGHPGWTVAKLLEEAPSILAKTSPDLVLMSIGTNDAVSTLSRSAFGQQLRELAKLVTNGWGEEGAPTSLVVGTIGPMPKAADRARELNQEIISVAGELRAQGRAVVVAPVDAFVQSADVAGDGVHFSSKGYASMARAFASVLASSPASTGATATTTTAGGVVILAIGAALWFILRR